jgi:hypothetical protein
MQQMRQLFCFKTKQQSFDLPQRILCAGEINRCLSRPTSVDGASSQNRIVVAVEHTFLRQIGKIATTKFQHEQFSLCIYRGGFFFEQ